MTHRPKFEFPPAPAVPEPHLAEPRKQPPRPFLRSAETGTFPNELGIPVVLPDLRLVLPDVAIAFDSFTVHRDGMFGFLRVAFRDPLTDERPMARYTFHVPPHTRHERNPNQELWRLGMAFADGRMAFTPNMPDASDNDFILTVQSAGGDSIQTVNVIYISPIPPPGQLHLLFDLGSHGEHRLATDTAPIINAAAAAKPLWP